MSAATQTGMPWAPSKEELDAEEAKRQKERDRNRASRIRAKAPEDRTEEESAWEAEYSARTKRGRPRKLKEVAGPPPTPKKPAVYRAGKPAVGAISAPAAPTTCGDPDCAHCAAGGRLCPVTGKAIHPPPPIEECEVYATAAISGIGYLVRAGTGVVGPEPTEAEIKHLAPAIQLFVHRRLGGIGKYSDIFAMITIPATIGIVRYSAAMQAREEIMREQRPTTPQATPGEAQPS